MGSEQDRCITDAERTGLLSRASQGTWSSCRGTRYTGGKNSDLRGEQLYCQTRGWSPPCPLIWSRHEKCERTGSRKSFLLYGPLLATSSFLPPKDTTTLPKHRLQKHTPVPSAESGTKEQKRGVRNLLWLTHLQQMGFHLHHSEKWKQTHVHREKTNS